MRPIDADALLAELLEQRDLETEVFKSAVNDGIETGLRLAIKIANRQPTIEQPTWISCEERLPKPHEDVLVYDKTAEQVTCGCLSFLGEWFGVPMKNVVTHWMPLPQPPKGDE